MSILLNLILWKTIIFWRISIPANCRFRQPEKRKNNTSQMRLRSVFKMRMSILNTATTEQMGYDSISFFVCFPLMNQIVITSPFCQIKKVAEIRCFFTAILYILYGSIFVSMFNWRKKWKKSKIREKNQLTQLDRCAMIIN